MKGVFDRIMTETRVTVDPTALGYCTSLYSNEGAQKY